MYMYRFLNKIYGMCVYILVYVRLTFPFMCEKTYFHIMKEGFHSIINILWWSVGLNYHSQSLDTASSPHTAKHNVSCQTTRCTKISKEFVLSSIRFPHPHTCMYITCLYRFYMYRLLILKQYYMFNIYKKPKICFCYTVHHNVIMNIYLTVPLF